MILKKFDTPTDVFIIPGDIYENDNWTGDVLITDDEHDFVVTVNNKIAHRLTSNGFINVMTREDFEKNKSYFEEGDSLIDGEFLMLPGFIGEIGVKVVFLMEGEPNIHIEDLDLNEYLMHQEGFSEYHDKSKGVEYCITIPDGAEICLGKYNEDEEKWEVQRWSEV
jgi:hypothetical protein